MPSQGMIDEGGALAASRSPVMINAPSRSRWHAPLPQAFNDGNHLMIEAGTGTGKSIAYLVPATLWATTNNQRVIISTNTINLQEQLLDKDLPILRQALKDTVQGDRA